ncbi:MAG: signal peptide peptidase SppA [Spirochaetes bacterium]|nr:MAG: signal peptide peptidase SppA [Spirochaetota bacterium]
MNSGLIKSLLLVACVAAAVPARGAENPFLPGDRFGPASYFQGPFSPLMNPALGGVPRASSLGYSADMGEAQDRVNHLVIFNAWGFTFSRSWIREIWTANADRPVRPGAGLYTIGKSVMFGEYFGLGVTYSYSQSDQYAYNHYRSLEHGLVFQPWRFFALGYVLKDMNGPRIAGERLPRTQTASISFRPFHEFLTLSADAVKTGDEKIEGSDIALSAEMLFGGCSVMARWGAGNRFLFGVQIPLSPKAGEPATIIAGAGHAAKTRNLPSRSTFSIAISGEADREAPVFRRSILKIEIGPELGEIIEDRLFEESPLTLHEVLGAIRDAASDDGIEGIFMRITGNDLGFAQVQEIREEMKRFRARGKKIHASLSHVDNKGYYLAAAANEVSMSPSESFSLTGLSAEVYFFRAVLEKIGVKIESVRRGKYKSFNEPFTRDRMSDEYRENMMALLLDLNMQFLNEIIADRNLDREKIDELFGKGFLTPQEAREAGFINGVFYPDDALKDLRDRGYLRSETLECVEYARSVKRTRRWGTVPAIAVVHVSGNIVEGEGGGGFAGESTSGEGYAEILEEVFSDQNVKAVVVRVDSGGGSALASDHMWHALGALKKKWDKPVVFSFGNVAASGGYFLACTGDKIYGMPGTVTGSIGVISGKLSLQKLYETLGINKEVIKMSEFADIYSESRDLTPREREVLQRGTDFIYTSFTDKVADARKIDKKEIPGVAEGRVFTGSQAKDKALMDELGGLLAAIESARAGAGIDDECRVLHFPRGKSPLVQLVGSATAKEGGLMRALKPLTANLKGFYFGSDPYLYMMPYRLDIK